MAGLAPEDDWVLPALARTAVALQPWATARITSDVVGARALGALGKLGISTYGPLAQLRTADIRSLSRAGPATIDAIREGVSAVVQGAGPSLVTDADDGLVIDREARLLLADSSIGERPIPWGLLPPRVASRLAATGVLTLGSLTEVRVATLLAIPGVGPGKIGSIRAGVRMHAEQLVAGASDDGHDEAIAPPRDDELVLDADTRSTLALIRAEDLEIPFDTLPTRTANALRRANITSLGRLEALTIQDALAIRNFGRLSIDHLRSGIGAYVASAGFAAIAAVLNAEPKADVRPPAPPANQPYAPSPARTFLEHLPSDLADDLERLGSVVAQVDGGDLRFGLPGLSGETLWEVLQLESPVQRRGAPSIAELLEPRLRALASRIDRPIPLEDELDEILPPVDRSAAIVRSRRGWDGTGAKTLEETGRVFNLTRERIRQIEVQAIKKRLGGRPIFAPTAAAILEVLEDLGGAAYEEDLAAVAIRKGLIRSRAILGALDSLSGLRIVTAPEFHRVRREAGEVISLNHEDTREVTGVESLVRRLMRRRGIVGYDELRSSLRTSRIDLSPEEVTASVNRVSGTEWLGGGSYYWRPDDADSEFYRPIAKALLHVGPQESEHLKSVILRIRRADKYGTTAPDHVLEEAFSRSQLLRRSDEGWVWAGQADAPPLGVAELPILRLLEDRSAVTVAEIMDAEPDLKQITIHATLSNSPLFERAAPGVYTLLGRSQSLGSDDLPSLRRRERADVRVVCSEWEADLYVITVDVQDHRRWSGLLALRVEARRVLLGKWIFRDGADVWTTTVTDTNAWGGFMPWLKRQNLTLPAQVQYCFDPVHRTIVGRTAS